MLNTSDQALYNLSKEAVDILYRHSNIKELIEYPTDYFYRVFYEYLTKSTESDTCKFKSLSRFVKLSRKFTKVTNDSWFLVDLRQANILLKISKLMLKMAEASTR